METLSEAGEGEGLSWPAYAVLKWVFQESYSHFAEALIAPKC